MVRKESQENMIEAQLLHVLRMIKLILKIFHINKDMHFLYLNNLHA